MQKALIKKQLLEIGGGLFRDKKTGLPGTKKQIGTKAVLFILLFLVLCGIFFSLGLYMVKPLYEADIPWFYFTMMSILALCISIFAGALGTHATLYLSKDTDLLLSMPIPPYMILRARLFGVWIWNLIFEGVVLIPAYLVYIIRGYSTLPMILCSILMFLLLSLFILAVTCLVGWLIAAFSSRMKNKSIITALISVGFMILYFGFCSSITDIIGALMKAVLDGSLRFTGASLPFLWIGTGSAGDLPSVGLIALICVGAFALVYFLMSKSFLRISLSGKGVEKKVYKETLAKQVSVDKALMGKELRRFLGSATYLVNCGLGLILLPAMGVAAFLMRNQINFILDKLFSYLCQGNGMLGILLGLVIGVLAGMIDITAPSISLEGKSISILKALPVTPMQVFRSKARLHITLGIVPVIVTAILMGIALRLAVFDFIVMLLLSVLFLVFSAYWGLFLDLRHPNLTWTAEIVPIKQNTAVLFALLGEWGLVALCGVVWFNCRRNTSSLIPLLFSAGLVFVIIVLLKSWLKNRGTKIWEEL